jgi:hypothetical protein
MRKQISSTGGRVLLLAIAERYKQAKRDERQVILDEFVGITGYHRKHAIRMLGTAGTMALAVRACVSMTRPYGRPWSFSGRHQTGFAASD